MSASSFPTPDQLQALAKTASARPASRVSPPSFVRDLAVRGYSLGMTDQQILIFLRKQVATHPGLEKFLGQVSPLKRVLAAAKRAALSSSPAGAAKNSRRVARLTVGRLLSEIGTPEIQAGVDDDLDDEAWAEALLETPASATRSLSPATQLRIRVSLAAVSAQVLESINSDLGWNTVQLSYARMNLLTGWTTSTSKRALTELVQMRLITELPSARKASARRFKVNGTLNAEQREVAAGQHDTVGRLMASEGTESLAAELIASITHSAWNYGHAPLGHRAWLVAVSDAAGIDPATLAVSPRNVSLARKALRAAGLADLTTGAGLGVALDAYAAEHGCLEAKRVSEQAYRQQAAERTAEIKHHQGLKADAIKALDAFTGPAIKIPKIETSRGRKFAAWLAASAEAFTDRAYPADLASATATELARRIAKRLSADRGSAKVVAGWVLSGLDVDGEVAAARRVQLTAARGLEHLGAGLAEFPAGDASEIEQRAWLKALQGRLAAGKPMAPEMRHAVAGDLRARLIVRGYPAEKATKASAWCVRHVAIAEAVAAAA